jgi:alpha-galactosidase
MYSVIGKVILLVLSLDITAVLAIEETPTPLSRRLDNGVGITPAMGWNNWNSGLGSTASSALAAANAFKSLGLDKLGYQYVNRM